MEGNTASEETDVEVQESSWDRHWPDMVILSK